MFLYIRNFLILILLFLTQSTFGQAENPDFLRSTGKIYVVIAVIIAIFLGIVIFLVYLERKVKKLERDIEELE